MQFAIHKTEEQQGSGKEMVRKVVAAAVIWFIKAVDISATKDGDILTVTVEFFDKPVITKRIPLRRNA